MNVKIVVTVEEENLDEVLKAMGDAGAGKIGNYSYCSSTTKSVGRFLPEEGAKPSVGAVGKLEVIEEMRVEMICPRNKAKSVINAIRKVHSYEEPAIDIYPLISEKDL